MTLYKMIQWKEYCAQSGDAKYAHDDLYKHTIRLLQERYRGPNAKTMPVEDPCRHLFMSTMSLIWD